MQGTVLAVEVAEGDEVAAGQVLCIVEAMKMENEVHAHRDGVVRELSVAPGEPVSTGQIICVVRRRVTATAPRPFCSEAARGAAEPLSATASRVEHWLLVEYPGHWPYEPLDASCFTESCGTTSRLSSTACRGAACC